MEDGSRLLLIERVSPDRAVDDDAARRVLMSDMQMMVVLGGRERTIEEFSLLLSATRLQLTDAIPTRAEMHLIEAAPVADA